MSLPFRPLLTALRASLREMQTGPAILAFLPALVLCGFWLGGEDMLIMIALGFPICLAFSGVFWPTLFSPRRSPASEPGEEGFDQAINAAVRNAVETSRRTGCILLELDEYDALLGRFGDGTCDAMMTQLTDRLRSALRSRDAVFRVEQNIFAICVAPVRQLDLGDMLHMAGRLQSTLEDPIAIDGATAYVTASVGLAIDTGLKDASTQDRTGPALLNATIIALAEARRHGPSATRAYSRDMTRPSTTCDADLIREAAEALENGQIQPWYQPQISTDTGRVSGFEALARWSHPVRGLISPAEFLPALQQGGKMERLGEVILYNALAALKSWDAAGLDVPHVGVNFAPEELRNPGLVKKIEWELDRFGLSADRLAVEILETVVASSPDDTVVRNIAGLSRLGCQIDLDDFGTGHASISSIRRFDVQRLKIDRSFVMKVDRDPEQQRMVAAILTMAEHLGLATLAEGVETSGEHAVLARLGCGHVQGYGIGRPMPLDQTADWMHAHLAKLTAVPPIRRRIS
ncbi:bifunctional diguanylate cyclase/phosphodiesterase [Roseovarius sp. M141]|uniref:putative bifunctional diguanylate cyclase/phosphodiesterase n=1 Tax=Roseovarius sp. M141 TaxID=2583806 RepID=UPI0020CFAAC1|nr:GGDEF domain-containing phosphodiesterase [Roseovarius sp. M141]MCQ0091112.1 EAL domain-containing protein [Roseovarius sp. M141]